MTRESKTGLDIYEWKETGYSPLVFSHDWMVSLLNWEPIFDLRNAGEIERHVHTDEVFILIKGKAVIFTVDEGGMQVKEMIPGAVYNVLQGVWHNLLASQDASWVIVENRDTHLNDGEFRRLDEGEMEFLWARLPAWAK